MDMRRMRIIMKELKRMITAAAMFCIVATGAFAQNQKDDQKRPPKPPEVVKEKERERPPNRDQHQDKGNENKRGKP